MAISSVQHKYCSALFFILAVIQLTSTPFKLQAVLHHLTRGPFIFFAVTNGKIKCFAFAFDSGHLYALIPQTHTLTQSSLHMYFFKSNVKRQLEMMPLPSVTRFGYECHYMQRVNKASIAAANAQFTSIQESIQVKVWKISGPWKWFAEKTILFDISPLNNSREGHTYRAEGPQSEWGANVKGHLFFHTASAPISEWSWLPCFLKWTHRLSFLFLQDTD